MVAKTKLPEFRGKPLIEVPKTIPQADFLQGDFGREVLEEYQGRVKADYENLRVLNVLADSSNLIVGSNPFAVVLINQVIREEGLRTATLADLERILKVGALQLKGTYEDSGLVLRTDGDSYQRNDYLAKDLTYQVKARGKSKMPVMISLTDLDLAKDEKSPYGLAFKLRDDSNIIYAPVLNKETSRFDSKDIDEKTGLPKKLGKGNRNFYTRQGGLSGLDLNGSLNVVSDWDDLDSSDSGGRVVVVSDAVAEKI